MCRSRADFEEPPAESPSTTNSSVDSGSRAVQSASLPGRPADWASSSPLRRVSSPGRLRRLPRLRGDRRALDDLATLRRVRVEPAGEPLADDLLRVRPGERRSETALRLTLELRVGQLDGHDRDEPLAHVVAGEVGVLRAERLRLAAEAVQRRRERAAEPPPRASAVAGAHDVDVGADALVVEPLRPRQGDVDGDRMAVDLPLVAEGDDGDQRVGLAEQLGDEVDEPLLRAVGDAAPVAVVDEGEGQAGVEQRRLVQALGDRVMVEVDGLEDAVVGPEPHEGACPRALPRQLRELLLRPTACEGHRVTGAVARDLDLGPVRQRVDDGHADAVQAAGHGVGLAVELPAGVERGQGDLDGRAPLRRMPVDGDAAAVVGDLDPAVVEDPDRDALRMPGEVLVDGVVHHLPDEVVQPAAVGRADVHRGPLADALEPLEDADVLRAVLGHGVPRILGPAGRQR